jgi:hypothetical protein
MTTQFEDRVSVNCVQCAGDCVETCKESGLPVHGGLITDAKGIAEIRSRIPLLRAQRFQRQQLHDLIDEAERAGAWLYSEDERPWRPHGTFDRLDPTVTQAAVETVRQYVGNWRSPAQLRALLSSKFHPEDFYRFRWTLRDPTALIGELLRVIVTVEKMQTEIVENLPPDTSATVKPFLLN